MTLDEVRAVADGLAELGSDDGLGGATVLASDGARLDGAPLRLTFIPYHVWGNRGLSTMRVWVPEQA